MLCSEILNLYLQSSGGRERKLTANLEEIWSSGALLSTDARIQDFTSLWFVGGGCKFRGEAIAGGLSKGLGYFIEMRFNPDCRWSARKYHPQHLFNPLVLLANRIFEATLHMPGSSLATQRPMAATSFRQALRS